MHVDSMKFSSTKSVHLKKIVTRVIFLHLMYIVVCSIVNVMIKNIKTKAISNNETKINCMFERLIDAAQMSVRQNINIIRINVINERARFLDVCKTVSISIDSITISISVFVMKRSNHELLFKRFFQRVVRISFINMNNESLEMILHFLKEKERVNFLKMSVKHINNKKEKSGFAIKLLNV